MGGSLGVVSDPTCAFLIHPFSSSSLRSHHDAVRALRCVARLLWLDATHIPHHGPVSKPRTIRSRIPNASSSLFHGREHCRGGCQTRTRRVSPISRHELGLLSGLSLAIRLA